MWVVSYTLFSARVGRFIFVAVRLGTSYWSVLLTACVSSRKKGGYLAGYFDLVTFPFWGLLLAGVVSFRPESDWGVS
jgi:hypothetical protein